MDPHPQMLMEVIVPPTTCPLSPNEMAELQALYDPLSHSDDFAVTMYLNVLQFVSRMLT